MCVCMCVRVEYIITTRTGTNPVAAALGSRSLCHVSNFFFRSPFYTLLSLLLYI